MIRLLTCAALLAATPGHAAPAACPAPTEAALGDVTLPHAREAATSRQHLGVLVLGGAATLGIAADGDAYSIPARLEARLRDALPGIEIQVATHAGPRRSVSDALHDLDTDLARTSPSLVIWSSGSVEAGDGTDIDDLGENLQTGIERIRAAGADVVLVNLQYAPSIARIVDLEPYRDAIRRIGEANEAPVLDRYAMMRAWSDSGALDLDATEPDTRVQVARALFDCLAAALAEPIADAVERK